MENKNKIEKEKEEISLQIGTKIRIGTEYSKEYTQFKAGQIITLIEGHFEYDNGLYTENQTCPAIWNEEEKDFDSIYHLFGNDFENFMDCIVMDK